MAIVSVLIGALVGLGSFLGALFVYDFGFLWALTIYSATGIATTLTFISLLMVTQSLGNAPLHKAKIHRQVSN